MDSKIIHLKKFQTKNNSKFMLFLIILISVIVASLFWKFYVENQEILEAEVPQSQNIKFNKSAPVANDISSLAQQIRAVQGKPILIYFYTTWCGSCHKNFADFNEIARKFQNTDLEIIAVAIDKDLNQAKIANYMQSKGDFYFQPQFIVAKDGFREFLKEFGIKYKNRIPYTALFSSEGKLLISYNGAKSTKKLEIAIRKEVLKGQLMD